MNRMPPYKATCGPRHNISPKYPYANYALPDRLSASSAWLMAQPTHKRAKIGYKGSNRVHRRSDGVGKAARREQEVRLVWFARTAALFALTALPWAAAPAHAQENLDAGKTPAQLFDSDCSVCHKTPRGLASKSSSFSLSGFLRQHYTSSRQTATALATYLASVGGAEPEPKPAAGRGRTTAVERNGTAAARRNKPKDDARPATESAAASAKKPPEKKDAAAKPDQAAKMPDLPALDAKPDGGPKTAAALVGEPGAKSSLPASSGESPGGPLQSAIPIAGALPATRPPPRRTDNIAD
jgi:hypothetical protein